MADFLPDNDAELVAWMTAFSTYANANLAALGLVAADMTPVTANQTAFATSFTANIAAQNAAKNAVQTKEAARETLETAVRVVVRKIQAVPTVTNAQRSSLGIALRESTRTPIPPPTSRPVLTVDTSQRLQHTIGFGDELTPNSRAKPMGVTGCEIWAKIGGTPPLDNTECRFVALDSKTPYVNHFDGADGGKLVYYMARWLNTRAESGPWSATVTATVAA